MTLPAADQKAHAAAWGELLEPHLDGHPVFNDGEVDGLDGNPGTHPPMYVVLYVERVYDPVRSMCGARLKGRWRVMTRCAGTRVGEVRDLIRRVGMVETQTVTVDGLTSTPIEFETQSNDDPANGRVASLLAWVYEIA